MKIAYCPSPACDGLIPGRRKPKKRHEPALPHMTGYFSRAQKVSPPFPVANGVRYQTHWYTRPHENFAWSLWGKRLLFF